MELLIAAFFFHRNSSRFKGFQQIIRFWEIVRKKLFRLEMLFRRLWYEQWLSS
jgi:hypothetical protein